MQRCKYMLTDRSERLTLCHIVMRMWRATGDASASSLVDHRFSNDTAPGTSILRCDLSCDTALAWVLLAMLACCGTGCGGGGSNAGNAPPAAAPNTSTSSSPMPAGSAAAATTNPAVAEPATEGEQKSPLEIVGGDTFDFGTGEVGQEFEHVYEVKNVGKSALSVHAGKPSCSNCTSFKIDKETLQPGESLKATMNWKIINSNEIFRQHAPIGIENGEDVKLYIAGKVVNRIVVEPAMHWNLGEVGDSEGKEFHATIGTKLVDHFDVPSVTCADTALKVTATPLTEERLKAFGLKCGYDLHAVLDNSIPKGEFKDRVTINVLEPKPIRIVIEAHAQRVGPVRIFGANWTDEQSLLRGGSFDPGKEYVARLNLFVNGADGEVKVDKIKCADDRFSVEIKSDEKLQVQTNGRRKYDLFVKVAASNRSVVYSPKKPLLIAIETNQPKVGVININWSSSATGP